MSARVIVIGSGPCGAIAARELVSNGLDVTLLDAGSEPARGMILRVGGKTMFRWVDRRYWKTDSRRFTAAPGVEWHSSPSLGGLSNYWTSAVPRFAPQDFADGASLGDEYDWPIRYEDVAPFYTIAERALSVTGRPDEVGCADHGITHAARFPDDWRNLSARVAGSDRGFGPMPMANGAPWMLARRGTGFNSYHCLVKPLESSPTFHLVRNARVTAIRWSAADGRAIGVEHIDAGTGSKVFVAADAVVLAAGAIDSTQILLRSTSDDFPDGLGNTHGVLGTYLHDHPRQWWAADLSSPLTALSHTLYVPREPYVDSRPLDGYSMTIGLGKPRDRVQALLGTKVSRVGVQIFGTMVPTPETTVRLGDRDDIDAPVAIDIDYAEPAREQLERARGRFSEMFASAGITATPRGPFDRPNPGSSIHYGGTVRMHARPEHGVLDRWNRIHGVPNVVVCDLSCFTTGPEKNPTLTAMAIAVRAARRLAADLGAHSAAGDVEI